jgi:phosphoribosylglycinamide formyltransferase-1
MRLAVLVSGRGSNLKALLDAEARGQLAPAEIGLVLSNRPAAPALGLAQQARKATCVINHCDFPEREQFDQAMLHALAAQRIGAVILAGFMRILGKRFVDAWPQRIINVHPSLLPAFPGLNAPAQALAHWVKVAGCTVHFVEYGVDTGPIIAQACVPVRDDDDADSLHRRIQAKEQELLPRAARDLARGALTCDGRVVHYRGTLPPTS